MKDTWFPALEPFLVLVLIIIPLIVGAVLYYAWQQHQEPSKEVFATAYLIGVKDYNGMLAFDINITIVNLSRANATVIGVDALTTRVITMLVGRVLVTRTIEERIASYTTTLNVPPLSVNTTTLTFNQQPSVNCVFFELLVFEEDTLRTYRVRTENVCFTTHR